MTGHDSYRVARAHKTDELMWNPSFVKFAESLVDCKDSYLSTETMTAYFGNVSRGIVLRKDSHKNS